MKIIKYNSNRQFSISQALKNGWEKEWEGIEHLKGLKLQDRKKSKHKVTIKNAVWDMGLIQVYFEEGGWLCLDHAIEQFKCVHE